MLYVNLNNIIVRKLVYYGNDYTQNLYAFCRDIKRWASAQSQGRTNSGICHKALLISF